MSQNDKIKGFLLLVLFDPIGNILMFNKIQAYFNEYLAGKGIYTAPDICYEGQIKRKIIAIKQYTMY